MPKHHSQMKQRKMTSKSLSSNYVPNKQQVKFHTSPARYRFYGGAAGGGKTRALIEECLAQIGESENRGVPLTILFFRRTFPELEGSVIKEFLSVVPVSGRGKVCRYNYSTHSAKFLNGSTLRFAFCANENDVYKYQGAEFDVIAIDELTHFTEFQFKYLMSRLRTTKEGVFANFIGASNPGNVGHAWVKRLWIDRHFGEGERPSDYDFIPAKVWDNKVLLERDPTYIDRLKMLPPDQVRALLEGDWDLFEGQFFTEWVRAIHVVDEFDIPDSWLKYRSIDYGYRAPFCCLWFAIDHDGKVWVYREMYNTMKTASENAQDIVEMSKGEEYQFTTCDPSMFSRTPTGETISEILQREGVSNLVPADNGRIAGWNSVREYMAIQDGYSKLAVFPCCRNLVRTLPMQQYDDHKADDLNSDGEDHAVDALRYFVHTLRGRKSERPKSDLERKLDKLRERDGELVFNRDNYS